MSELVATRIGAETEPTICLICGASDFALRFKLRDWAYELPGEFHLVTCQSCGFIYQNPRPTQSAIGAFYLENYEPFTRNISQKSHASFGLLKHLQWRNRCLQVARLCSGGRLLDVGTSTGIFLDEMRRYGRWTLAGIESNEHAAGYARDVLGLDIFVGQIEEVPWSDASFDVVTLWDVLEHLPNPRSALLKIHALLVDQGYLIFSIPNGNSLDARLFGKYWIGLDPPRHLSVFTLASIIRLLSETGFELETSYCFYGRYTTFALSVQQWLHAHLRRSIPRRLLEYLLFLPVWRYLTLPYFWVLDQLRLGAILTIRARPKIIQ